MKRKNKFDTFSFSMLSLFSGGGLLDIGFMNNGFQIKEAIEIEPSFITAYNYALEKYVSTSTNRFLSKKLVTHQPIGKAVDASCKKVQKRLGRTHKKVWGLAGGPPCQDYSAGGNNAGIEGERGKLIRSYMKIVKSVNPKFIFFENVEGLYKTKAHQVEFKKFVRQIERLGYCVWYDILNVLEYGFAQDRPRVVLVAFKKEIVASLQKAGYKKEKKTELLKTGNELNVFNWPVPKFKNPKQLAWPGKWPFKAGLSFMNSAFQKEYKGMQVIEALRGITSLTPNQLDCFVPKSRRFAIIAEGDTNRKSFKRLHRFRYSPTVAYGNNEVHLHPTKPRRLSVREALRLQTVPDNYILPPEVSLTHKFKLISNGVPVAMAELVAREIRRTLINFLKACENGHLVKRKKKRRHVKDPVKKHKTGKATSF